MNNKKNDIDIFQKYLKSEEKYIKIALTDSSYKNYCEKHNLSFCDDNKNLATLGDAIIKFVYAKMLYNECKNKKYSKEKINKKSSIKRSLMLIFSITLHNIPEGMAVGVAFGSLAYNLEGATLISSCLLALGIGLQNFPEGTAVSVPLRREGFSRKKAFIYGSLSGIVEPISGVIGALLVLKIRLLLPFLLAFAAGAMIYVVVEEIIPESQTNEKKDLMALFTLIGFSLMMVLDVALG